MTHRRDRMNRQKYSEILSGRRCVLVASVLLAGLISRAALADAVHEDNRRHLNDYHQVEVFNLPSPAGPADVLPDGRIIVLSATTVLRETAPGSRSFVSLGTLPDADFSTFGASFMSVAPCGDRIAVGNNGGASFGHFQVGIFALPSLTGAWYTVNNDSGTWIDNRFLALTAGAFGSNALVTALDTASPVASPSNRTIIENIGGFSGGIAFDAHGNLYAGNGFATTGPSQTGAVKAFRPSEWLAAFIGPPIEFETQGVLVVTTLSGSSLHFDGSGNLFVGGGDFFGGGEINFAALVSRHAVRSALRGHGPADVNDPAQVRKFDPDPGANTTYATLVNRVRDEAYLLSGSTAYVFSPN